MKTRACGWLILLSFMVALSGLTGCAKDTYFGVRNRALGVPNEFAQTEAAIATAENSEGVRYCPETVAKAKELASKAVETYWACRTEEAKVMLAHARALAMTAEVCAKPRPAKVAAKPAPKVTAMPTPVVAPPPAPKVAAAPPPAAGTCLVRIREVNFAFDSAKLTSGGKYILDAYIHILSSYPNMKVEIGGHTDDIGPEDYNQELSEQRAQSVADHLLARGVAKERIKRVVGYGETKPLASNDSPENRALNRRVEVTVCE